MGVLDVVELVGKVNDLLVTVLLGLLEEGELVLELGVLGGEGFDDPVLAAELVFELFLALGCGKGRVGLGSGRRGGEVGVGRRNRPQHLNKL